MNEYVKYFVGSTMKEVKKHMESVVPAESRHLVSFGSFAEALFWRYTQE